MKKNIKFILITLILVAVMSISLVGCVKQPNLTGGNPDATTYNNNSLVVTQGEYIYFVNGKITLDDIVTKKDNKYGNVVKSAIYRAKKDGSNPEVLVPQVAMDSNNSNGISVLGNYVYFTSPSTATAKDGSLQKSNTDFYRVQISGKKIEKLITLEGNTNQYKFTDKGLIYLANNELTYLPYGGSAKVITDNASSTYFPVTSTYTPNQADATMAVYFTESPDSEEYRGDPYNDIKYVDASGEVKTLVSGKDTLTSYSLKNVATEKDGGAAIYYEPTIYDKGDNVNKGLFGIKIDKNFAKTADGNEKQFANSSATVKYIDFASGVYVIENNQMFIPKIEDGIAVKGDIVYELQGQITDSNILTIRDEEDGKRYIYYFDTDALLRVEAGARLETAEYLIDANIVTDYVKPVLSGNTFYYINSKFYSYIYMVDISVKDAKHKILGVRTADDRKSYINEIKELDEEAREEHDKLYDDSDFKAEDLKK